jgi:hypothetical protein
MIQFKLNAAQEKRFFEWQRAVFNQKPLEEAAEEDCCCSSPFTFHFTLTGIGVHVLVTGMGKSLDLSGLGDWG